MDPQKGDPGAVLPPIGTRNVTPAEFLIFKQVLKQRLRRYLPRGFILVRTVGFCKLLVGCELFQCDISSRCESWNHCTILDEP